MIWLKAQISLEFMIALIILIFLIGSIISIQNYNAEKIEKSIENIVCLSDVDSIVSMINRNKIDPDYIIPDFDASIDDGKIIINEGCWARVMN